MSIARPRRPSAPRATPRIDPASARDLLEQVPRACICFARDNGPEVAPVSLLWREGRYLIGMAEQALCRPVAGQEVVLLVDEGRQFFELRAITVRGDIDPVQAPVDSPPGRTWYELSPTREAAWDFGALRMVRSDEP